MAKVLFSKLGLTKNTDVVKVAWNDQQIEVKQYIPMSEKLDLISKIINLSVDEHGFYNPCRIHLFTVTEIIMAYAGITVTEKQKEDVCKLYDLFVGTGFAKVIMDAIPEEDKKYIEKSVLDTIKSVYEYKNSVMGVLDTVSQDYNNLNFDAQNIQAVLGDENNVGLVKQILDKLG